MSELSETVNIAEETSTLNPQELVTGVENRVHSSTTEDYAVAAILATPDFKINIVFNYQYPVLQ